MFFRWFRDSLREARAFNAGCDTIGDLVDVESFARDWREGRDGPPVRDVFMLASPGFDSFDCERRYAPLQPTVCPVCCRSWRGVVVPRWFYVALVGLAFTGFVVLGALLAVAVLP